MAGFRTHVATSTLLGIGYAAGGYFKYELPLPTCLVAGGLCGVAGMLPDLDSSSSIPIRESTAFAAAVTPLLLIDRFRQLGWPTESMVLAGAITYLVIRFGLAELLKRCTVHRGMWHSLPAAAIAGLLAFLVCCHEDLTLRLYKTAAVVLGYMSHLVLDELSSIHWYRRRLRLKCTSGSCLKLWSPSIWANISTYGKLAALVFLVQGDPMLMKHFGQDRSSPRGATMREAQIEHSLTECVASDSYDGPPSPSNRPQSRRYDGLGGPSYLRTLKTASSSPGAASPVRR